MENLSQPDDMTSPTQFKLGLKPPRPGAVRLRLATYLDFRLLPAPPPIFGHYDLIESWGMLGNDQWGDCALAGACHQEMLWTKEGGSEAPFDTTAALANYSAVTGFNPNAGASGSNPTDQGTEISALAEYWQATGIADSNNTHHKIAAFVDLNPGDLRELWIGTWLFQTIGLGFAIPNSAMQQTQAGQPWDVVADDGGIDGGHYVPAVGRIANGNLLIVTWGQLQEVTPRFFRKYNNQGIVALSEEMLVGTKSIDGFDDATLRADLQAL